MKPFSRDTRSASGAITSSECSVTEPHREHTRCSGRPDAAPGPVPPGRRPSGARRRQVPARGARRATGSPGRPRRASARGSPRPGPRAPLCTVNAGRWGSTAAWVPPPAVQLLAWDAVDQILVASVSVVGLRPDVVPCLMLLVSRRKSALAAKASGAVVHLGAGLDPGSSRTSWCGPVADRLGRADTIETAACLGERKCEAGVLRLHPSRGNDASQDLRSRGSARVRALSKPRTIEFPPPSAPATPTCFRSPTRCSPATMGVGSLALEPQRLASLPQAGPDGRGQGARARAPPFPLVALARRGLEVESGGVAAHRPGRSAGTANR